MKNSPVFIAGNIGLILCGLALAWVGTDTIGRSLGLALAAIGFIQLAVIWWVRRRKSN